MAKRRPIPPYLTLPDHAIQLEPADGWLLLVEGQPPRAVLEGDLFPSWDSSLKFSLRRRFKLDQHDVAAHLGIPRGQAVYQLVVRLETGGGLFSEVAYREVLDSNEVEVDITPDSRQLTRDITLVTSVIVARVHGKQSVLSPSNPGSRVWSQAWSSKLEGGRVRLPMEAMSFSKQLYDLASPNALFYVSVAEDPLLDFEQAVCVYLNADQEQFVRDFERGDRAATAMVWDAVVRQVLSSSLSMLSSADEDHFPEGSVGAQLKAWIASMFPGESIRSIATTRQENPSLFEAKVQSWVNAGELWSGGTPNG